MSRILGGESFNLLPTVVGVCVSRGFPKNEKKNRRKVWHIKETWPKGYSMKVWVIWG